MKNFMKVFDDFFFLRCSVVSLFSASWNFLVKLGRFKFAFLNIFLRHSNFSRILNHNCCKNSFVHTMNNIFLSQFLKRSCCFVYFFVYINQKLTKFSGGFWDHWLISLEKSSSILKSFDGYFNFFSAKIFGIFSFCLLVSKTPFFVYIFFTLHFKKSQNSQKKSVKIHKDSRNK